MSRIDLLYPTPIGDTDNTQSENSIQVKISHKNLINGVGNLYRAMILHIIIITLVLIPLFFLSQKLAIYLASKITDKFTVLLALPLTYPTQEVMFNLFIFVSWIPLAYLLPKAIEYHEQGWNREFGKGEDWSPYLKVIPETMIEDFILRYNGIFKIFILTTLLGCVNILVFVFSLFFDYLIGPGNIENSPQLRLLFLLFRVSFMIFLVSRFGLAPVFITKEEQSVMNSLKSSWRVTEDNFPLFFSALFIFWFLSFISPVIFGIFIYILLVCVYYLFQPDIFRRGHIWPVKSKNISKHDLHSIFNSLN